ncbi:AAA family ATPase [Actinokineospora sp. PR83]|uniref:UvrD-helicase domain-containing protein n=1 Tax=Actinokineospora sp. PR83 TaxID=2884908 RepID=UPI0027E19152|nr:UvrD-helicase domain-containing protein [Actinokineospora sp. PR83]MCG8918410.1 AAA family ATPase [Actinokineospora sp. PR83]
MPGAVELVAGVPGLDAGRRRVLAALVEHTATGGGLFVRVGRAVGEPDAFQVSRGGVRAVVVDDLAPGAEVGRALVRHAEEHCAGLRGPGGRELPSTAVGVVWVRPGADPTWSRDDRLYQAVNETGLAAFTSGEARHLSASAANRMAGELAKRLRAYRRLSVEPTPPAPEQGELLDGGAVVSDVVDAARDRPFESWLTFLHPSQRRLVTRRYSGPARISGPAGTGKTVVALHRLRHLARRHSGPLLFTTFVRTLPEVHARAFHTLAPELDGRVEFTNLHAWAVEFLRARGTAVLLQGKLVDAAFAQAWLRERVHLEPVEPTSGYWRDELTQVIGGRGVGTFEEYLAVPRRGRRLRLTVSQREAVWRLHDRYRDELARRGACDFTDVITLADREVRRRPPERPYAAVVVDEVQDLPLVGLRLLHRLAGNGPDRLLLVGDGQQQVYPGGWRLSEAGIPILGRGEVLRVNYRNRTEILDFARRIEATDTIDDLDGGAGVALRDAEAAHSPGGTVTTWRGTDAELPAALVGAVRALRVDPDRTAVIAFGRGAVARCRAVLERAGIAVTPLERYTGEPDGAVKVGTVLRAKGLDFQAVLVVNTGEPPDRDDEGGRLSERRKLVAATRARDHLWWATVTPNT